MLHRNYYLFQGEKGETTVAFHFSWNTNTPTGLRQISWKTPFIFHETLIRPRAHAHAHRRHRSKTPHADKRQEREFTIYMTNDESAAHQPIRWRPRPGLICCSIRPLPLPTLGQHPTNASVAHWTKGIAHLGRFALQRLRRGDRHLSLLSPPSYQRRLLESPRPTTPPPRTITRQQ
jgi:hypothetical protein